MYNIELGKSGLSVPTVAVGCMRIAGMEQGELREFIETALESNVNFFDHADIYGGGYSETNFARAAAGIPRESYMIQTKCGIRSGMFDFSFEHIVSSVENSLSRLSTDYIDVLLLHRPDALMEPCEVARAFEKLKSEGKVRHFGVSNQNPYQMELLQKYLDMPLCADQLQFGIMHTPMLDAGLNVNMYNDSAVMRDGGTIDYCRLKDITIQPWSPLQYGFFEGCFIDCDKFPRLNEVMDSLAEKYNTTKTALAFAWILRHPAKMQPVTGTTSKERLKECFAGADIRLSREDFYAIYRAAGNVLP